MDEDHAVVVVDNDAPPSTDDRADDGGADTGATTSTTSSSTMACRDPPFECTIAEYGMLLNDVSESLRVVEDAFVELYDCARYGELDACRAILDVWSTSSISSSSSSSSTKNDDEDDPPHAPLVSRRDVSGNTPLHVACANGHASVVRLLLSRGYDNRASNDSGNTPLHWASAAGRSDIVGCLLDHHDALYAASHPSSSSSKFENDDTTTTTGATTCDATNGGRIDVLRKNAFGRSALTEGFASGDARTIERLLNHDSAEEERLIGGLGGRGAEVEGEMEAGEGGGAAGGGRKYDDDGRGEGTGRKSGDVDIDVDVDDDIVRGKKEDGKERNDNGIIHEFDFVSEGEGRRRGNAKEEGDDDDDVGGRSASVLIRELVRKRGIVFFCRLSLLLRRLQHRPLPPTPPSRARAISTLHTADRQRRRSLRSIPNRGYHRPRHMVRVHRHVAMDGIVRHGQTNGGEIDHRARRGMRHALDNRGGVRRTEVGDYIGPQSRHDR